MFKFFCNKLLIFLIISTIITKSVISKKCGHSEFQKTTQINYINLSDTKERILQDKQWELIRIHIDYTTIDSQNSKITDNLIINMKNVVSGSVKILESMIKVKRLEIPLQIGACRPGILISPEIYAKGVESDLIIFPLFTKFEDSETEAAAAPCVINKANGRAVAGIISFKENFDFSKTNAFYNRMIMILHEFIHILAFNPIFYESFINSNGEKLQYQDVITSKTINGKIVYKIKTPKVVETARKYFNCDTLDGVELEDQGGSGTAGSHWETRIMYGDIMMSALNTEMVFSEITLALLEDSGWYQVNYYTGGLFRFGKNRGCSFLTEKCIQNGISLSRNEFPVIDKAARTCFAGRSAKGIAFLKEYSQNIPVNNQYFLGNPKKGGFERADYCPITVDYEVEGWYNGSSCWNGISTYPSGLGETIGSDSSCFYSSLTFKEDIRIVKYKDVVRPICHKISCDYVSRTYTVFIRNKHFICDTNGGVISDDEFDGLIDCVDFNLICTKTVECGDVIDCVNKKSLPVEPVYDYIPEEMMVIPETDLNFHRKLYLSYYLLVLFSLYLN